MVGVDNASDRRLVFLGAPGSGKGTQAEILAETLGIPAISTGDMLREAVAAGSDLGARVSAIMSSGELVDDGTMAEVVRERLRQQDAAAGFLLDGYPRTLPQARTLSQILSEMSTELDSVLLIDVPEEELMKRALARQRADDQEEVIRNRIRVYHEKTEPLVEFYGGLQLLRSVDGDQTIDEVAAAVRQAVEENA